MHIDISALRLIEAEKGVSIETVLDAIQTALLTAYRHTDGFARTRASISIASPARFE